MKALSFLVLSLFLLSSCAPKSDLDEANKKIAELQAQAAASQAQAAALQAETAKIQAKAAASQIEADKVKAEAETAKSENQNLEAVNTQLQAKVDEKPALPVTVSFRKALIGHSNVAIFNTTIKQQVPILVLLQSAALGTTRQFEVHLDSTRATELGHLEGAVIENGDTITIQNKIYSPISFTVNL